MSIPSPSSARPAGTRTRRPTVRELPADLLTPVGAFLRLRHRGPAFLLESVERGQQVGRYSFLGAGCRPLPLDASPKGQLYQLVKEILPIAGHDANAALVEMAVTMARSLGREVATQGQADGGQHRGIVEADGRKCHTAIALEGKQAALFKK